MENVIVKYDMVYGFAENLLPYFRNECFNCIASKDYLQAKHVCDLLECLEEWYSEECDAMLEVQSDYNGGYCVTKMEVK